MDLTLLTSADLETVTGGADYSEAPSSGALAGALQNPSDRLGMGGPINPGGQVFENSHAGPSAYERVNSAFDRSTRVMSTFNELGGALTQSPGFGNGDVMKP